MNIYTKLYMLFYIKRCFGASGYIYTGSWIFILDHAIPYQKANIPEQINKSLKKRLWENGGWSFTVWKDKSPKSTHVSSPDDVLKISFHCSGTKYSTASDVIHLSLKLSNDEIFNGNKFKSVVMCGWTLPYILLIVTCFYCFFYLLLFLFARKILNRFHKAKLIL